MEEKFSFEKYSKEYRKKNYEAINFVVKKGDRAKIKALAEAEGISIGELFRRAVSEKYHVDL